MTPDRPTRPNVGFSPVTPQCEQGMRMEPPESVPMDAMASPAATAAPEPLLDRPGDTLVFQGFLAGLTKSSSEVPLNANSFKVALPKVTAPALRSRATACASLSGTQSAYTRDAAVVRIPAVAIRSL